MDRQSLIDDVLKGGLAAAANGQFRLFTVALYLDHESKALSLCFDTQRNSRQRVAEINQYSSGFFQEALANGDLKQAALWQANVGRNLSLGDFAYVNVARASLGDIELNEELISSMVQSLNRHRVQFAQLSPSPSTLVFACSSLDEEVGLTWSLTSS